MAELRVENKPDGPIALRTLDWPAASVAGLVVGAIGTKSAVIRFEVRENADAKSNQRAARAQAGSEEDACPSRQGIIART
jgi:hypothetical protein